MILTSHIQEILIFSANVYTKWMAGFSKEFDNRYF